MPDRRNTYLNVARLDQPSDALTREGRIASDKLAIFRRARADDIVGNDDRAFLEQTQGSRNLKVGLVELLDVINEQQVDLWQGMFQLLQTFLGCSNDNRNAVAQAGNGNQLLGDRREEGLPFDAPDVEGFAWRDDVAQRGSE